MTTPEPVESFWNETNGTPLAQGDYLRNCPVPKLPATMQIDEGQSEYQIQLTARLGDLIVVTQSCDLANKKLEFVSLCPIFSLATLRDADARYGHADRLDEIRKGRIEALHMLGSPDDPDNNHDSRVVDFREIHSLPLAFLQSHAARLGTRKRLKSPYLEHFSQAFARFFMRVGLPSTIRRFQ